MKGVIFRFITNALFLFNSFATESKLAYRLKVLNTLLPKPRMVYKCIEMKLHTVYCSTPDEDERSNSRSVTFIPKLPPVSSIRRSGTDRGQTGRNDEQKSLRNMPC